MSDSEKWGEYDLAKGKLHQLAGYYSKFVDEEEQKANPDQAQITQWETERRAVMALSKALDVENQAAIANINATYGPILHAIKAKG